ncbi:MAG: glycosyltransferase family 2 protein, partial [Clostridia bacterium]|nr:glycosyltransferase family 2 protein [Clostridia bacterium]
QCVPSRVFAGQRDFREHAHELFDQNLLYTPWNKLFLADYIKKNQLYFPQTFWDDFPFNLSVVRDIERVAVTEKKYYHFIRKREESETARYRDDMYEKREEEDGWMKELYQYWGLMTPEVREFLDRRYIERLIGCVENLTNRNCTLPRSEKMREISYYISTPRAREAVKNAQPRSLYMKVMLLPVKVRSTLLTYLESNVISYVKSGNTKLFATLKARR